MATTSLYLKLVANLQLKPTTAEQAKASTRLSAVTPLAIRFRREAASWSYLQNLLCFDTRRDFDLTVIRCIAEGG
jgi:hypothetical protein